MSGGAMVTFSKLRPNVKIRHANGSSYLIVRVEPGVKGALPKVWARWRDGPIGRFGKEVVQITPAHVRGFRRYVGLPKRAGFAVREPEA